MNAVSYTHLAIAAGIAPGGGLFCPTEFPALTADEMQALLGKRCV